MKHLSATGRPILNSALFAIMLAKGLTFQIIEEALSTVIDSMTLMVNAGGQPTIRREKMFVTLTINRIDKKTNNSS